MLTNLQQLSLRNNFLTSTIPSNLGFLTNLAYLQLFSNSLIGTLPIELSKLIKLNSLFLQSNLISGTIPLSYSAMIKLVSLNIGNNKLNNIIPSTFINLKYLSTLILNLNKLTGNIENVFTLTNQLQYLQILDLSNNLFSGQLSSKIGEFKVLNSLNLAHNSINGNIPTTIKLSSKLQNFNISNNKIDGILLPSLLNFTNLVIFDLSNNLFSGKVSNELCDLKNLNLLYISNNNFSCYASCLAPPADTYVSTNISINNLKHCYGVQDEIICKFINSANIYDALQKSKTYTPIIVENRFHPYLALTTEYITVYTPYAVDYTITFDVLTMTELFQDIIMFCSTPSCLVVYGSKTGYSGLSGSSYPGLGATPDLVISASSFVVKFTSNGTYVRVLKGFVNIHYPNIS